MEYKITWQEAFKTVFVAKNKFMNGVWGTIFILPVLISFLYIEESLFIIFLLTIIIPLGIFFVTNFNSGWQIRDDFFQLKTFMSTEKIKISSMKIGIVNNDSGWSPSLRLCGAGLPGLLLGKFRLKNKETAVVFKHLDIDKLLIIWADDKYYLVGHPEIDKLYDTLLSIGADSINFE